jgi:hypothetical protein
MALTFNVQLNDVVIPSVCFIWHRMSEFVMPINHITEIPTSKLKDLYNITDIPCETTFVVIQRHIFEHDDLYLCLHSLLYYYLHNHMEEHLMIIPSTCNINTLFDVKLIPLNNCKIIELSGGLKVHETVVGSVHIHDCSFSPPNSLHFKVDTTVAKNEFICYITQESLNIHVSCLFTLFNCFPPNNSTNVSDEINNEIAMFSLIDI